MNQRTGPKDADILKLIVILLVMVLAVACGAPATTTDTPTDDTADSGEEQPTEEPAGANEEAASGEAVELTYWMAADPTLEAAMDEILAGFTEQHSNISVKREAFPFVEYFQKLLTSFGGGAGPDVFWIDVQTAPFASRGILLPQADLVDEEYLATTLPSSLKEGTWQGTLYAIPLHQLAEGIFINAQMAEEAGIRLPTSVEDAWTWDEFVEIANQLTVREGDQTTVWGFAQQRPLGDWSSLPIIHQNGGQPLSPELDMATGYLNSPESVEALTWFQELFTEHRVISVDSIPDGFPNGQIAMIQAPSTYRAALENNFPDFEYVVVPLFRGPEGCAVMTGGWNLGIAASSEHPEQSWELVRYLTNEGHAVWIEKSNYLPVRNAVMDEPKFDEAPWNVLMESMMECAVNRPATEHYQFFADTYNAAIRDIALGGDVQQILDAAAATLDQELSR